MLQSRCNSTGDDAEVVLSSDALGSLLAILRTDGYEIIAPTRRNGVITLQPVDTEAELPAGAGDRQAPGIYRRIERSDGALFAYANGPHSPKDFLRSPVLKLFEARLTPTGPEFTEPAHTVRPPLAFVGVRSCDLEALGRLTAVLGEQPFTDPDYCNRWRNALLVAVECTHPAETCFCTSVGVSPRPAAGYDLLLTELIAGEHRFLVKTGSTAGADILARLKTRPAAPDDLKAADRLHSEASARLTRHFDPEKVRAALLSSTEDEHWNEVAKRCLACGNCTQVCPTCFCFTVHDSSDLDGTHAERWRKTDSCFTLNFSFIHGGSVRSSVSARYRQWVMHKFVYWLDQFGTLGCTGCGRCITWCPAAIDLTEEIETIRARARQ